MRLIDADAEVKKREKLCEEKNCEYLKYRYQAMCKGCPIYEEIEAFDSAEKVEAEPVRHGRWILIGRGRITKSRDLKCSVCGNYFRVYDDVTLNAGRGDANFCPNCGAYMREEGAENG